MTKIIKTFVATVTAMALFASCTKESVHSESVPSENGRMDVRISAVMGELTPVEETKATTTTVIRLYWENGDKVYAYDADKYLGYLDVTPSNNRMDATLTSQEGGIIAPSGDIITLVHCNLAAGITDSDSNGAPDIADGNILFDFKAQGATDPFVLYGTLNVSGTSETGEKRSVTDKTVPFEFATSFMSIAVTDMEIMDVDSITVSGINTACKLSVKNNDAPDITGEKDASSSPMTKRGGISQPTSEKQRAMFNLGIVPDNNSGRKITVYQGDNRYGSDFTKSEIKPSKHSISVYEMTAIPSYQITGSASPEAFGAVAFKRAGRSVTTAYAGDAITVVATPAEGYEVDSIAAKDSDGGDVTVTDSTFIMPDKNVTVTATFKKVQYTVSKADCDNGSFTLNPNADSIAWGTEVTVIPSPDSGYEVDTVIWTPAGGSATDITSNKKFTMPKESVTVTVTFKPTVGASHTTELDRGGLL